MPIKEPRIRDWPMDDRPRDKLREQKPRDLSNVELLAMLIGPGNARYNGLELARKVLASARDRLSELTKKSITELMQIYGIGRAKASAASFIRPLLRDLDHEEFGVLFLDSANQVINFEIISRGGMTATYVDPRVIFKKALEYNAVSLILAHNRPSGDLKPRRGDEILAQRLVDAAIYLDIKLVDYLIVVENGYYSFAEEGLLASHEPRAV